MVLLPILHLSRKKCSQLFPRRDVAERSVASHGVCVTGVLNTMTPLTTAETVTSPGARYGPPSRSIRGYKSRA